MTAGARKEAVQCAGRTGCLPAHGRPLEKVVSLRTAQVRALWGGHTHLTMPSRPLGLGRTGFFLRCLGTFFSFNEPLETALKGRVITA